MRKVAILIFVFVLGAITPIVLFFKLISKCDDAVLTWKRWFINTCADLFGIRVYFGYNRRCTNLKERNMQYGSYEMRGNDRWTGCES